VTYWQIAAGGFGRDYAKDFFRFGMAFVGGPDQIATMETVEVGDRLLLKRGLKSACLSLRMICSGVCPRLGIYLAPP
jgi:hypothetical protein